MAIQITDPDTEPDTDTDLDPYRDTGKTCLGGGMHCPSASSLVMILHQLESELSRNVSLCGILIIRHLTFKDKWLFLFSLFSRLICVF